MLPDGRPFCAEGEEGDDGVDEDKLRGVVDNIQL